MSVIYGPPYIPFEVEEFLKALAETLADGPQPGRIIRMKRSEYGQGNHTDGGS